MSLSDTTRDLYKLLQEKAKTPRWAQTSRPERDASGRFKPGTGRRGRRAPAKKRWKIPPNVKLYFPYAAIFLAILAPLLYNPPRSNQVPPYLIGVWESTTPGYEDRYLMFSERNVAFGTGRYEGDSYIVAETETSSVDDGVQANAGKRIFFKIRYMKPDRLEYDLAFYYDPPPAELITFKNQEDLKWTKKGRES